MLGCINDAEVVHYFENILTAGCQFNEHSEAVALCMNELHKTMH